MQTALISRDHSTVSAKTATAVMASTPAMTSTSAPLALLALSTQTVETPRARTSARAMQDMTVMVSRALTSMNVTPILARHLQCVPTRMVHSHALVVMVTAAMVWGLMDVSVSWCNKLQAEQVDLMREYRCQRVLVQSLCDQRGV